MLLQFSYIGLSVLMTIILVLIGIKTINKTYHEKSTNKKKKILLIIFISVWHLYLLFLTSTGIMLDLGFPPRFFILTILPAFIFIGLFSYQNRNSQWLFNISPHWLVFYQSFRIIIEVIFIYTVYAGILHSNVTIMGYNFDIIFAFTALIIGLLTLRSYKKYKILLLFWNYFGLIVIGIIIFLFQTTIYLPEIYDSNTKEFPVEFLNYPYILVPAFLMPSAVFIHVVSILQVKYNPSK